MYKNGYLRLNVGNREMEQLVSAVQWIYRCWGREGENNKFCTVDLKTLDREGGNGQYCTVDLKMIRKRGWEQLTMYSGFKDTGKDSVGPANIVQWI